MTKIYHNYHKHDHHGNFLIADSLTKIEDYCKRAVELGHTTIFTTNHGFQGNIFLTHTLAKQYNLKMIVGSEAYYVDDRFEKDRSNKHLIIIAKNDNGVRQLNRIMSEASSSGFYYRPRIDKELLFSLNPNDVIITSACVGGIWNDENLIKELQKYFKNNFYLEVQNHNDNFQKQVNQEVLRLHKKYNIPIIHANDSHYIFPEDEKYRKLFLKAKDVKYPEEDNFILDYPDYDTIFNRYITQGILSKNEIKECLDNTLIFDECEELSIINDEIKLPSISDNPKKELRDIIVNAWNKEKHNIPKSEWKKYTDAIAYEMDIVEKTHMQDYFILDYKIVQKAQKEYGGRLTNTGRGSAPSFYITKLLGLTDIDRIASPITLFPTRFMSVERILGARSLPDIDLNATDSRPFITATEDLLGKENCAWMIAWKPLQKASAFRLYCKAIGMDISEYDDIAKDISKCAKEKKDSHYVNDKVWKPIIDESKHFVGVIESISQSPCSMLLYDKSVAEEVGLIRTVDSKTKQVRMCCLLDGYNCDKYKYLKNDYLTVTVWAIIKDVCELANIPIPTIQEINQLLDDKTYDIYAKGLTSTINQADSDFATGLVKTYAPHSVSDMSAFVAIIRPGCASLLNDFVHRLPYTTGVKELDNILIEGSHRMIYQELIMKYLIWLGIPETGSYDIIKKIAKKKFKEPELAELKEKLEQGWIKQVGTNEGFEDTWKVVENASRYSFNASHSLSYAYDSLYGAYLKSHYPLEYYTVALNYYDGDEERTNRLIDEVTYFNIKLAPITYGKSKDKYFMDKKTNTIYKGIASIKYLNSQIAKELYDLSQNNTYNSFVELLNDITTKTSCDSRQLSILISLKFFSDFGNNKKLMSIYKLYDALSSRKQIKFTDLETYNIDENVFQKYAKTKTAKMYKDLDMIGYITEMSERIPNQTLSIKEQLQYEIEHLGAPITLYQNAPKTFFVVTEYKTFKDKLKPYITLYNVNTGEQIKTKVKDREFFELAPFKLYDLIKVVRWKTQKKTACIGGEWKKTDEDEQILSEWIVY